MYLNTQQPNHKRTHRFLPHACIRGFKYLTQFKVLGVTILMTRRWNAMIHFNSSATIIRTAKNASRRFKELLQDERASESKHRLPGSNTAYCL